MLKVNQIYKTAVKSLPAAYEPDINNLFPGSFYEPTVSYGCHNSPEYVDFQVTTDD